MNSNVNKTSTECHTTRPQHLLTLCSVILTHHPILPPSQNTSPRNDRFDTAAQKKLFSFEKAKRSRNAYKVFPIPLSIIPTLFSHSSFAHIFVFANKEAKHRGKNGKKLRLIHERPASSALCPSTRDSYRQRIHPPHPLYLLLQQSPLALSAKPHSAGFLKDSTKTKPHWKTDPADTTAPAAAQLSSCPAP